MRNSADSLQGLGILVTRPVHQGQALCRLIENAGGMVMHFPTLIIRPTHDKKSLASWFRAAVQFDWAIFTSANAVWQSLPYLEKYWKTRLPQLKIAAVGAGTRDALRDAGLPVHACPTQAFGGEALLALPQFTTVRGQRFIIFSGEGGRDWLEKTLSARGASVSKVALYRREKPDACPPALMEAWETGQIQAVVCTSNETLYNLFAILPLTGQTLLQETQIFGVSDRINPLAKQLGLKKTPIIADHASDEALLDALLNWKGMIMNSKNNENAKEKSKTPDKETTASQESKAAKASPVKENKENKEAASAPAPAAPESTGAAKKPKKPPRQYGLPNWQALLSVIALILALLAVIEVSYVWKRLHDSRIVEKDLQQQTQDRLDQQDSLLKDLQQQMEALNRTTQENAGQISENQSALQNLSQSKAQDTTYWALTTVRHFLQLAQLDLQFSHDVSGALVLLQTANQHLAQLGDPRTLKLQQAITQNISDLKALPTPDLAGTLIKLNVLSLQISKLPLVSNAFTATKQGSPANTAELQGWKKYWQRTREDLSQLIIVRRHDEPVMPLISSEQQLNLVANIQAKLSQASWAMLHGDNTVYRASLQQAAAWIQQYYAPDAAATQAVLQDLKTLEQINVAEPLPDLSSAILLTDQLLKTTNTNIQS